MMYLSKGILTEQWNDGLERISHCGRIVLLGPELAKLWRKARYVPQPVPQGREQAIRRMEEKGIVSTTEESGALASYRLLAGSILCPEAQRFSDRLLPNTAKRLWKWINEAGLRLTASELVRLEERRLQPTPSLLGEDGRQRLTEMIYRADTIQDGILDNLMEHSPVRDSTVDALLKLLQTRRLFLI